MTNSTKTKFWAGGFLYNPHSGEVFLHHRDSNTKFNPDKWAFFGGLNESEESPIECFLRELSEEIGLCLKEEDATPLYDYLNEELNTYRYIYFVESQIERDLLTLGEGAGFDWVPIDNISSYDLTEKTERDLNYFKSYLNKRLGG